MSILSNGGQSIHEKMPWIVYFDFPWQHLLWWMHTREKINRIWRVAAHILCFLTGLTVCRDMDWCCSCTATVFFQLSLFPQCTCVLSIYSMDSHSWHVWAWENTPVSICFKIKCISVKCPASDQYHSHAAIKQMVNRKSGNSIISCRWGWSKPYVFSGTSRSHCFVLFLPGMTSKRNFPPSSPLVGCSDTLFPGKKMAPCGK